jgi:uncharacterized membrane protein
MTDAPLVTQPTKAPTAKLVASTTTGAAVLVVTWVAEQAGLALDAQTAGALVLVGAAVAGYLKRNRAARGNTPGTNRIADHGA